MKHTAALLAAALLGLPSASQAANDEPPPAIQDKAARQAEARRLHEQADGIRRDAEARHTEQEKTCWQKILVTSCMDEAMRALREEKARARELDRQAREIERDLRRREVAERQARRAETEAGPTRP